MIQNNIKELRKKNKITQQELADRAEVTRQTILAIENNKYYPSLKLAFDIAQTFGVGIEDVFYLSGKGE